MQDKHYAGLWFQNLVCTFEASEDLLSELDSNENFKVSHLFIRPANRESREAQFIIDPKGYISDRRKEAYHLSRNKRH